MVLQNNFMLLGVFDTIANAIMSVVGPAVNKAASYAALVVSVVIDSIVPVLGNILLTLLGGFPFKAVASFLVNIALSIIEAIIILFVGSEKKLAAWVVTNIFSTYDSITNPSRLECLTWSPINYIFNGEDKNVVVGSMTNPYYLSIKLMNEGIKPTAMIVFALIIMVELFQITIRTEGMRNSGFESPFKLMLKVAICKILLDNTELILRSIFEVGTDMALRLSLVASSVDISPTEETLDVFTNSLMKFRPLILLLLLGQSYVQSGLVWLIIKIFLPFIVLSRMIEIYMMIVLAPIPFATFAHQEFSSVGKSYLKQFIGVSFKAAVMFVIVIIYGAVMTIATIDVTNIEIIYWAFELLLTLLNIQLYIPAAVAFFILFGLKPLVFSFMLLSALQGADSYTRKITGAWY